METTQNSQVLHKAVEKVYKSEVQLAIRRAPGFSMPGDDPTLHTLKIGGAIKGRHPLSGLTDDEERQYLAPIIGTSTRDVQWNAHVKDYWSNISEIVPADGVTTNKLQGRLLEFIVEFDNATDKNDFDNCLDFETKAEISKKGRVIRGIDDYVLFRYCLVYGRVANKFEDIAKSPKIRFYLYSTKNETLMKHQLMKDKLKAQSKFIEVLGNPKMVDALLLVFNQDLSLIETEEDKHLILENYVQTDPTTFLIHANNQHLGTKALLKKAVSLGIVHNPANTETYYYGDNREVTLGTTIDDAVLYLKSTNTDTIEIVKAIKARVATAK